MNFYTFQLRLNRAMTNEDELLFDRMDDFAGGALSYILFEDGRPTILECDDVEAPSLIDAVADVSRRINKVNRLRAVAVLHDDVVTLSDAAQRCSRSQQSLSLLASGKRGPGGFPAPEWTTPGTSFFSWAKIAAFLRSIGDDVDEVNREVVIADHLLRVADELASAGTALSPGTLRQLGLMADTPPVAA